MKTAVNDSYAKLKTLKDLECLNNTHDHKTRGDFCIIRKSDLKEEAIKWYRNRYHRMDDSHWLTFFNITEDDLKPSCYKDMNTEVLHIQNVKGGKN